MDQQDPATWLRTDDIAGPLHRMTGEECQPGEGWRCDQIRGGFGAALGVWRVSGMAPNAPGDKPWSMVLKGWALARHTGSPADFDWPLREADLYRSGLLRDLPGVTAPAFFGVVERDDSIWVWLEDLTSLPQPEWTVERFAIAARNLGRMNGAYLAGRSLPNHPSLSRNWLEGWVSASASVMAAFDDYLDHPVIGKLLPPEVAGAAVRIWDRRQAILDDLQSMPQTFSHLDAFNRNIFFRQHDGEDEMVLIDWSFTGIAAVGEELAPLSAASLAFTPSMIGMVDDIERTAFPAYIDGLREAGWQGSRADVERAWRMSTLLRYGPGSFRVVFPVVMDDTFRGMFAADLGLTPDDLVLHLQHTLRWLAERADLI